MKIPRLADCACGHRGLVHHEDGSCSALKCECVKFTRERIGLPPQARGQGSNRRRLGAGPQT